MSNLFQTHRKAFILYLAAAGFAVLIIAQISPRLASLYFRKPNPSIPSPAANAKAYQKDYSSKGIENFVQIGSVKIECPSEISISDSVPVTLSFKTVNEPGAHSEKVSAKLVSTDFEIVSTPRTSLENGDYEYQWSWLISPKQTGHRMLTMWVEPDVKLNLENSAGLQLNAAKTQILAPVTVLTELGLTTKQSSTAKAIGAILGLLGTVTGYSFLKKYFEKDKPQQSSATNMNVGPAQNDSVKPDPQRSANGKIKKRKSAR